MPVHELTGSTCFKSRRTLCAGETGFGYEPIRPGVNEHGMRLMPLMK